MDNFRRLRLYYVCFHAYVKAKLVQSFLWSSVSEFIAENRRAATVVKRMPLQLWNT